MWLGADWYEWYKEEGLEWAAKPGYYRLLLPVPHSNGKIWSEQLQHLASIDPAWRPAPVCVAVTALLVHLETGNDLLNNAWIRCAEARRVNFQVVLFVPEDRVNVTYLWDGRSDDYVWASAAQQA